MIITYLLYAQRKHKPVSFATFPIHYIHVGVLAGMRSCGIIVLLNELVSSESNSQVYGCLCNYYALHPNAAREIGISISLIMMHDA